MEPGTMFCNHCGTTISDQARFCSSCGRPIALHQAAPRLLRSRLDRKIGGVCAGLAEHLDLDTSLIRILWVFLTFASGFFPGLIAYILAWIIIPEEPLLPIVAQHQHPVAG
jgi:phage shock protein C